MTKLKNSDGEKQLLAKVKLEMNQPRLTKSVRMDLDPQANLKPDRSSVGLAPPISPSESIYLFRSR
jgi:hypothetical protein